MFETKAKIKTTNFLRHIEFLAQNASDSVVEGFQDTEKELLKRFTTDTFDLIEHNECGAGLENLLTNLHEMNFTLDNKAVELAKEAIKECGLDYSDWTFIEALVK